MCRHVYSQTLRITAAIMAGPRVSAGVRARAREARGVDRQGVCIE